MEGQASRPGPLKLFLLSRQNAGSNALPPLPDEQSITAGKGAEWVASERDADGRWCVFCFF